MDYQSPRQEDVTTSTTLRLLPRSRILGRPHRRVQTLFLLNYRTLNFLYLYAISYLNYLSVTALFQSSHATQDKTSRSCQPQPQGVTSSLSQATSERNPVVSDTQRLPVPTPPAAVPNFILGIYKQAVTVGILAVSETSRHNMRDSHPFHNAHAYPANTLT